MNRDVRLKHELSSLPRNAAQFIDDTVARLRQECAAASHAAADNHSNNGSD